jgi:hypothetical protein
MHKYNNFHAQTVSVAGPKKNSPYDSKPRNWKNVARKDFLRLTPSKWPSSENTGACFLIEMIRRLTRKRTVCHVLAGLTMCAIFYHHHLYYTNGHFAHGQAPDAGDSLFVVSESDTVDWPRLVTDESVACRSYDLTPDSEFGKHVNGSDQLDCKDQQGTKAWVQILGNVAVLHPDKHNSLVQCSFQGELSLGDETLFIVNHSHTVITVLFTCDCFGGKKQ